MKKFLTVDDVGNIINPMIVDGQIHGGVVQELGRPCLKVLSTMNTDSSQCIVHELLHAKADDVTSIETYRRSHLVLIIRWCKRSGEAGTIGSTLQW